MGLDDKGFVIGAKTERALFQSRPLKAGGVGGGEFGLR